MMSFVRFYSEVHCFDLYALLLLFDLVTFFDRIIKAGVTILV